MEGGREVVVLVVVFTVLRNFVCFFWFISSWRVSETKVKFSFFLSFREISLF